MRRQHGFSLLELSIVLVIIGLIAGGIVAGASMIRAAELRAMITEQQQFLTSVHTFRDKYIGFPGDLKNATAFWGYPGGNPANCPSTAGTGAETCNGDGDRWINDAATTGDYGERYMFWQHLANAELISGTYTGRTGSSSITDHDLGSNAPLSKLSGGGWSVNSLPAMSANNSMFDGTYGNILWIGGERDGQAPNTSMFTSTETWNFDKKMDDGKPATGRVVVRSRITCSVAADGSALTTSAADAAQLDAIYELDDDSVDCMPLMRNIF